ncbi:CBS domain-containing protein [Streptomyces sp. NPDC001848]|uniref:CBS domain-containing protein n=1 Tax=Streptomyces sp. NPDC001848 TaxID=3364618 RepID=UPI0036BFB5A2
MDGTPHRVGDVMTRRVVAVGHAATFKDIVKAMGEWKVSAVPVLTEGNRVVGVVSEADLLRKQELRDGEPGRYASREGAADPALAAPDKAGAVTAEELMTAPAVTVHVEATLAQAARSMARARVKRLPVVDDEGTLLGIVSRSDLLKVYLREDEDIAEEIRREIVARVFPAPSEPVHVEVRDGVVRLTGRVRDTGLVPVTARLVRSVEGVVDVDCALMGPPRVPDLEADFPEDEVSRWPWRAGSIT